MPAPGAETVTEPLPQPRPPETLMPALAALEVAWVSAWSDPAFRDELSGLLRDYVGRPSPLYMARRLTDAVGHPVYLKREDLNHTGAHKINNVLGQTLLARRMGKRRIIAETGAGQHGVATATACASRSPTRASLRASALCPYRSATSAAAASSSSISSPAHGAPPRAPGACGPSWR